MQYRKRYEGKASERKGRKKSVRAYYVLELRNELRGGHRSRDKSLFEIPYTYLPRMMQQQGGLHRLCSVAGGRGLRDAVAGDVGVLPDGDLAARRRFVRGDAIVGAPQSSDPRLAAVCGRMVQTGFL